MPVEKYAEFELRRANSNAVKFNAYRNALGSDNSPHDSPKYSYLEPVEGSDTESYLIWAAPSKLQEVLNFIETIGGAFDDD